MADLLSDDSTPGYAFYIDVGNLPGPQAMDFVQRVRQSFHERTATCASTNPAYPPPDDRR